MKYVRDIVGIALVLLGTLCLLVAFLVHQPTHNWVLFSSLAMIVAGVVLHIIILKRQCRY